MKLAKIVAIALMSHGPFAFAAAQQPARMHVPLHQLAPVRVAREGLLELRRELPQPQRHRLRGGSVLRAQLRRVVLVPRRSLGFERVLRRRERAVLRDLPRSRLQGVDGL